MCISQVLFKLLCLLTQHTGSLRAETLPPTALCPPSIKAHWCFKEPMVNACWFSKLPRLSPRDFQSQKLWDLIFSVHIPRPGLPNTKALSSHSSLYLTPSCLRHVAGKCFGSLYSFYSYHCGLIFVVGYGRVLLVVVRLFSECCITCSCCLGMYRRRLAQWLPILPSSEKSLLTLL